MSEINNPQADASVFDTSRCFVRIIEERKDGFIEFAFAIGEPEYFVELLLSKDAFSEFCSTQNVEMLVDYKLKTASTNPMDWQLSDVTQRIKQ